MVLSHPYLAQRLLIDVERMVTRRKMAVAVIDERRLDLLAHIGHVAAAWVEAAAARRVDWTGDIALEHDPLALLGQVRVRDRNGREERLGVRHDRPRVE